MLLKKIGVDDPINAGAIHTSCGIWGLIAAGLFDNTKGVISNNQGAASGELFGL
jgi:hypothetical protein